VEEKRRTIKFSERRPRISPPEKRLTLCRAMF